MKPHRVLTLVCAFGISAMLAAQGEVASEAAQPGGAAAFDWPQWQGPDRTGISKETGLLQQWPPTGPPLLWSVTGLGAGYGSLAIKGDHIFVQALNRSAEHRLEPEPRRRHGSSGRRRSGAAAATIAAPGRAARRRVDGDRLYVLTENGDLACLNAANGSPRSGSATSSPISAAGRSRG